MAGISISARFAWMWIQLPRVEEDCRELGITDTSATSVVVRLSGATVAGKELGVVGASFFRERSGFTGHTHCCPVLCGSQHHCDQEAGVISATAPVAVVL